MYLSSYRLGDHADELARLAPPGRAVVIVNAGDGSAHHRDHRLAGALADLGTLGYQVADLDLRTVRSRETLLGELTDATLIWVCGGNVFTLLEAYGRSGFGAVLLDLLARDAVCYGGYSAGVCVLGQRLHGLERCDDPHEVTRLYGTPARTDGLGLLPGTIVPHVDSPGHPESTVLTEIRDELVSAGRPVLELRDGDVWLVDGAIDDGRLLPRRDVDR